MRERGYMDAEANPKFYLQMLLFVVLPSVTLYLSVIDDVVSTRR